MVLGPLAERTDGVSVLATLPPPALPIEAHAANPLLGISLRYLHRLFEDVGDSVGRLILAQRRDRCRDALANPPYARRSVSEIAFACGFNDAAHFSRSFKARLGMSPRDARVGAISMPLKAALIATVRPVRAPGFSGPCTVSEYAKPPMPAPSPSEAHGARAR
jgi:AraC-like DNA-binding protein